MLFIFLNDKVPIPRTVRGFLASQGILTLLFKDLMPWTPWNADRRSMRRSYNDQMMYRTGHTESMASLVTVRRTKLAMRRI